MNDDNKKPIPSLFNKMNESPLVHSCDPATYPCETKQPDIGDDMGFCCPNCDQEIELLDIFTDTTNKPVVEIRTTCPRCEKELVLHNIHYTIEWYEIKNRGTETAPTDNPERE